MIEKTCAVESIELLQPLISGARSSDITDVITNTVGGILGYLASVPSNLISE